jgi:hypothetical protein
MGDNEEGMSWESEFDRTYGSPEKIVSRIKAERAANLTPAQRGRRGPVKKQRNFRCTLQTDALIDAMADKLGMNIADVIELAVQQLAKTKGIGAKA